MQKPFATTLDPGSSLTNHTGTWRTSRPVYVNRLPPCNNACRAGENIQQWLYHAEAGDYRTAWELLTVNNPMPAIMGRICYHPVRLSATAASSMSPSISTPASAFSATKPFAKAGRSMSRRFTARTFSSSAPAPPGSLAPIICDASATVSPSATRNPPRAA